VRVCVPIPSLCLCCYRCERDACWHIIAGLRQMLLPAKVETTPVTHTNTQTHTRFCCHAVSRQQSCKDVRILHECIVSMEEVGLRGMHQAVFQAYRRQRPVLLHKRTNRAAAALQGRGLVVVGHICLTAAGSLASFSNLVGVKFALPSQQRIDALVAHPH
jgi:hypothetical protein